MTRDEMREYVRENPIDWPALSVSQRMNLRQLLNPQPGTQPGNRRAERRRGQVVTDGPTSVVGPGEEPNSQGASGPRLSFYQAVINAICAGVPVEDMRNLIDHAATVTQPNPPAAAPAREPAPAPAPVQRGYRPITPALLRNVAEVYREAHAAGEPPTKAVAEHFDASHSTAARWVRTARKAGHLGPALTTAPGELE